MNAETYAFAGKLIYDAIATAVALKQCLEEEANVLKTARHPAALTELAAIKKLQVAELENFNTQLGEILAAEKCAPTPSSVSAYLVGLSAAQLSSDTLAKNWQILCALCQDSKLLNEQNGAAIELLSRHVTHSLQLLKNQPQLAPTYGPNGARKNHAFIRTRVKA
jgi:flagellar biosynthesis/type III secretory pathway chaperone